MSTWTRRQLPAYSPISASTVLAGARGAVLPTARARALIEQSLRQTYRATDALLLHSGTAGLQLAFASMTALGRKGPIALPAYCCYDVATAADGAGVRVVLYDIDPITLGPELESFSRALERGATAAVVAHLYGLPVDLPRIERMCQDAGAILVEDAAQATGTHLHGIRAGSSGSLSILSFGRGKGTTSGSGGALLAHSEAGARILAHAAKSIAASGRGIADVIRLAAQWTLGRPSLYGLPHRLPFLHLGETVYRAPESARRMSAAAVAALAVSRRVEDVEAEGRRVCAERWRGVAERSARVRSMDPVPGSTPGYLRFPMQSVREPAEEVVRSLGQFGVARGYELPLARLEPFRRRVVNAGEDFDGAEALAANLVTFPTHSLVTRREFEVLGEWMLRHSAVSPPAGAMPALVR